MKPFCLTFLLIAAVAADVSHLKLGNNKHSIGHQHSVKSGYHYNVPQYAATTDSQYEEAPVSHQYVYKHFDGPVGYHHKLTHQITKNVGHRHTQINIPIDHHHNHQVEEHSQVAPAVDYKYADVPLVHEHVDEHQQVEVAQQQQVQVAHEEAPLPLVEQHIETPLVEQGIEAHGAVEYPIGQEQDNYQYDNYFNGADLPISHNQYEASLYNSPPQVQYNQPIDQHYDIGSTAGLVEQIAQRYSQLSAHGFAEPHATYGYAEPQAAYGYAEPAHLLTNGGYVYKTVSKR